MRPAPSAARPTGSTNCPGSFPAEPQEAATFPSPSNLTIRLLPVSETYRKPFERTTERGPKKPRSGSFHSPRQDPSAANRATRWFQVSATKTSPSGPTATPPGSLSWPSPAPLTPPSARWKAPLPSKISMRLFLVSAT